MQSDYYAIFYVVESKWFLIESCYNFFGITESRNVATLPYIVK